jgi:hypothetical protein
MSVPSTRELQEIPVSQITRVLNAVRFSLLQSNNPSKQDIEQRTKIFR